MCMLEVRHGQWHGQCLRCLWRCQCFRWQWVRRARRGVKPRENCEYLCFLWTIDKGRMLGEDLCNLCALIELASSTRFKKHPPCIAHYKVDILCAYKVGFRSPLYIPTMGDKAVFCARNMPLDLEDDFIATLAFQFIPGWFPTRKRLNICGNAFYRPLVPFKEWP